ncbi:MAG: GNAT family N-acetyltransferase, partial [Sediminibacterium sp.]|nr:GNAT family N-acetyltransferase [Sediminibacterium sp.]
MQNKSIVWRQQSFSELSNYDLYKIIQLRLEVFSLEQRCNYQDLDNIDLASYHLLGFDKEVLVAYTRLVPPKTKYTEMSIGRVLTKATHRKLGLGKDLMNLSIKNIWELYGKGNIKIGAQLY